MAPLPSYRDRCRRTGLDCGACVLLANASRGGGVCDAMDARLDGLHQVAASDLH